MKTAKYEMDSKGSTLSVTPEDVLMYVALGIYQAIKTKFDDNHEENTEQDEIIQLILPTTSKS